MDLQLEILCSLRNNFYLYSIMITVGGKPGSGKSTVTKILAQELVYERIAIGDMKRKLAEEM